MASSMSTYHVRQNRSTSFFDIYIYNTRIFFEPNFTDQREESSCGIKRREEEEEEVRKRNFDETWLEIVSDES